MAQKVFVVHIDQVEDTDVLRNDVTIFNDEADANKFAKEFIKDERDTLFDSIEDGTWVEEDDFDSNKSWECYEDGYYAHNHTAVWITEQEIK